MKKDKDLQGSSYIVREIDLNEMIKVFWINKLLALSILFFSILLAFAYINLAQEEWSSKAVISSPQHSDFAEFILQVKQFQPVFDTYQDDGTILVNEALDDLVDSDSLFKHFVDSFASNQVKRQFLDSNSYFLEEKERVSRSLKGDTVKQEIQKLYQEWFERISIKKRGTEDDAPYVISFFSDTKNKSVILLDGYMQAVISRVHANELENLKALVDAKRKELTQRLYILTEQAKAILSVEIEKNKYSLAIAKSAGIIKPMNLERSEDIFNFGLGTKAIHEKIKILNSIENLSIIEPKIKVIDAKITALNNMHVDVNIKFNTFRYLEVIEEPIDREHPKSILIFLVAIFMGALTSIIIVLFKLTVLNRTPRE
ncbi:hypothetical protein TW74_10210 [Vibrio nigripulchritudo]|nr:hypothetical protein TW74_10210 [Vibrio nigripulchritudo]